VKRVVALLQKPNTLLLRRKPKTFDRCVLHL
jgi:hypothetical protein